MATKLLIFRDFYTPALRGIARNLGWFWQYHPKIKTAPGETLPGAVIICLPAGNAGDII
jgi:hypothetical protein